MIFGKLLNFSGLHMRCCKQERLAEGDFKELKDVEVPGGKATGEQRVIKGYDKGVSARSAGSVFDGPRLCFMKLWVYPRG